MNSYSERFARHLFEVHPEWRDLAADDPHGFPQPGSLLLRIPSPVEGRELTLRTYGDHITLDFGSSGWHEHFNALSAADEQRAWDEAIRLIDDLMADRKVIAVSHLFGRPAWSRAVDADAVRRPLFGHVSVVSWTGARDVTF